VHRSGTDAGISVSLDGRMGHGDGWRGDGPLLCDRGLCLSLVENACNGRQRMVGGIALSQDLSLRIEFNLRNRCPTSARYIFLSADKAALCQILAFLREPMHRSEV